MVDVVEALYDPLLKYHSKNSDGGFVDGTKARAAAVADATALGKEITFNRPNLMAMMDRLSANPNAKSSQSLNTALVERWKQDSTILAKLDADMAKNPAAAKRLETALQKNPDMVASKLLPAYTGGNLDQLLPEVAPAPAAAPATTPAQTRQTPTAAPAAPAQKRPAAAPKADAPAAAPAPAAVPAAAVPSTPAASDPNLEVVRAEINKGIFTGFADATDAQIKQKVTPSMVVSLAEGIADRGVKKYDVDPLTAKGFVKRIKDSPQLQEQIAENLRNNPDFVRELAKSMKDESEPPASIKSLAKNKMGEFMSQPEKLADSNYVSGLTSQMKMGSTMSGFSGILGKFGIDLSGVGNFFQKIFDWVRNFFNEFTGGNFASMQSSGRGFFQSFQHAARNASINQDLEASMRDKLKVEPLIGADGKATYKHTELVKDEKGVETPREVLNKIEVETMGGKIKVLPTSGAEAVRQPDGSYRMWFADTMDDKGRPQKLIQATLDSEQFEKYNARLKQYGDRNNPPQYQMYDEAVRGPLPRPNVPESNVVRVDRATGAVTDAPAANDPRYPDRRTPAVNDPTINDPALRA